jgi:hypothetical protein
VLVQPHVLLDVLFGAVARLVRRCELAFDVCALRWSHRAALLWSVEKRVLRMADRRVASARSLQVILWLLPMDSALVRGAAGLCAFPNPASGASTRARN